VAGLIVTPYIPPHSQTEGYVGVHARVSVEDRLGRR
jgi:hypothetical protein